MVSDLDGARRMQHIVTLAARGILHPVRGKEMSDIFYDCFRGVMPVDILVKPS